MSYEKAYQYLAKIITEEPVDIRTIRQDLPESLTQVIHRMLAKNRDERFQTWEEPVNQLKYIRSGGDL